MDDSCEPPDRSQDRVLAALSEIRESLHDLHRKADHIITDQDTTNALATQIETDVTAINDGVQTALTEIAALEAAQQAGQPIDFTSLKQALTDLDSATAGVASVDTAAAPPAAPTA